MSSLYRLALFDTLSGNTIPLWGSIGGKKKFGHQSKEDHLVIPFAPHILTALINQRASLNHNWLYAITDNMGRPVRFLCTLDCLPESLPHVDIDDAGQHTLNLSNALPPDGQNFIGVTNVGGENPTVIAINPVETSGIAIVPADIIRQLQSLPADQKSQLILVTGSFQHSQAKIHRLLFPVNTLSVSDAYIGHNDALYISTHNTPQQLRSLEYFEQSLSHTPQAPTVQPLQSPLEGDHRVEVAIRMDIGDSSVVHRRLKGLPHPSLWYGDDGLYPDGEIAFDTKEIANLSTSELLSEGILVVVEYQPTPDGYMQYVHPLSQFPLKTIALATSSSTAAGTEVLAEKFQLPRLNPKWKPELSATQAYLNPDNAIEIVTNNSKKKARTQTKAGPKKSKTMVLDDLSESKKESGTLPDEDVYTSESLKVLQQGLAQKKRDKDLKAIADKLGYKPSEIISAFAHQGINLNKTDDPSGSSLPSEPASHKPAPSRKKQGPSQPHLSKMPYQGSSKKVTRPINLPADVAPSSQKRHAHWQSFKSDEQRVIAQKMREELIKHGELPPDGSSDNVGGQGGGAPLDIPEREDDHDTLARRYAEQHPAEQAIEFVQGRFTRYPLYTLATLLAATAALELYHSWNLYPGPREVLIRKTLQAMDPGASAFEHEALRMLVEGTPEYLLEYWGSDTLSWWVTQASQHWCSRNNCSGSFIPDIFLHYILSPVSTRKDRFLKEIRVRVSLEPVDLNNPWLATIDMRRIGFAAALDFNPLTQQYWMARLNDRGLLQETSDLMYTMHIPVKVLRFHFLEDMMSKSQLNRFKNIASHPATDATNQYRPVVPYPMERQRYGVYTCATIDGDKWRAIDINGQEPGYYGVPAVIGYAHRVADGYCVPSTMDKWLSVLGSDGQTSLLSPDNEPFSPVRLDLQNTFKKPKDQLTSETCKIQYWKERRWKTAPATDLYPGSIEVQLPAHGFYRVRCDGQTATFTKDYESGMLFVWSWPRTALTSASRP
ncbi:hypothetical protein [Sansalvadorimonas verongulae]|uniref:hypothetical protein n=1 Tax=Sansalvadorimonas verongulae TaxID=2172824 RepID=UPI0012BD1B5E|nr:hypothetical protein [Sansalvadorimonas verongulae]MTI13546.1 hypothetical protein [Sansalvadorimonas verongulae]